MPYKDPDTRRQFMRQYQLVWLWKRRLQWILDNGPCRWCGSVKDLSVSYRNPATTRRTKTAGIWSLSDEKRAAILVYCEVLCIDCYRKKQKIWRTLKATLKPPSQ